MLDNKFEPFKLKFQFKILTDKEIITDIIISKNK
jgi:hypothetical protein